MCDAEWTRKASKRERKSHGEEGVARADAPQGNSRWGAETLQTFPTPLHNLAEENG